MVNPLSSLRYHLSFSLNRDPLPSKNNVQIFSTFPYPYIQGNRPLILTSFAQTAGTILGICRATSRAQNSSISSLWGFRLVVCSFRILLAGPVKGMLPPRMKARLIEDIEQQQRALGNHATSLVNIIKGLS